MGPWTTALVVVGVLTALAASLVRLRGSKRTVSALESQLLQAQKLESLGLLAGAVAHDFNNLLSAIRGYSELLVAETEGRNADRAREILKAADRAASLTRELLTFSRRERQETRPLELGRLVRETGVMFGRLLGPRIDFSCETAGDVVARVDAGRFQQVLLNLVVNARDAMPRGGSLRITTRPVTVDADAARRHVGAKAGPYALVEVRDTGTGIPVDVRERMFDPFFTTKPSGLGTGLGLSIVYGIVRQHDGFVVVRSTPGEGTIFSIYLPATSEEPEPAPEVVAGARSQGGSVVVVEDNQLVRDLVREMLVQSGHDVFATGDPEDALAHVEAGRRCDLLITDLTLPKLTGLQLVERARQSRPGIRALFMSGLLADPESFALLSGEHVLAKPFSIDEFLTKVGEALAAAPSA